MKRFRLVVGNVVIFILLIEVVFRFVPRLMPDWWQHNYNVQYDEARRITDNIERYKETHDRPRVLLVGDSYTRCAEVGYREGWTYKLRKAFPHAEFLNIGLGGLGPVTTAYRVEHMWKDVPLDVIVLTINTTDFADNVREIKYLEKGDTERMLNPAPYFGGKGKLGKIGYYLDIYSITYRLLKLGFHHNNSQFNAEQKTTDMYGPSPTVVFKHSMIDDLYDLHHQSAEIKEELDIMEKTLERLDHFCRERHIKLVVQYIPYKTQTYLEFFKNYSPDKYDPYQPGNFVRDMCSKHRIIVIDTSAVLFENKNRPVYLWENHMTALGHQLVSDILIKEWKTKEILPSIEKQVS